VSQRVSKDDRTPWRGDQRLRVELVFDGTTTRVDALTVVDGPVVQRPSLTGNLVAVVSVDGEVQVLQAFEDPRRVRAIAPPERFGHNYGLREEGRLIVDVPLSRDQPAHQLEIKLLDLSDLQDRPLEPAQLAELVRGRGDDLQVMAEIGTADVARHPDWQEAKKVAAILPMTERAEPAPASRGSGFDNDDQDEREGYTFEWWLHRPTQVVVAVRLDSADRVAGAARPFTDAELRGRAKGFQWNEEPRFTAAVERHRGQFDRLGPRIRRKVRGQRPEITDDFQALGFR
jgi:hypothetical protein